MVKSLLAAAVAFGMLLGSVGTYLATAKKLAELNDQVEVLVAILGNQQPDLRIDSLAMQVEALSQVVAQGSQPQIKSVTSAVEPLSIRPAINTVAAVFSGLTATSLLVDGGDQQPETATTDDHFDLPETTTAEEHNASEQLEEVADSFDLPAASEEPPLAVEDQAPAQPEASTEGQVEQPETVDLPIAEVLDDAPSASQSEVAEETAPVESEPLPEPKREEADKQETPKPAPAVKPGIRAPFDNHRCYGGVCLPVQVNSAGTAATATLPKSSGTVPTVATNSCDLGYCTVAPSSYGSVRSRGGGCCLLKRGSGCCLSKLRCGSSRPRSGGCCLSKLRRGGGCRLFRCR